MPIHCHINCLYVAVVDCIPKLYIAGDFLVYSCTFKLHIYLDWTVPLRRHSVCDNAKIIFLIDFIFVRHIDWDKNFDACKNTASQLIEYAHNDPVTYFHILSLPEAILQGTYFKFCITRAPNILYYTPCTAKLLGVKIGFTPSVCPSVPPSHILCLLCSTYSHDDVIK